jgi:hypothetical protein
LVTESGLRRDTVYDHPHLIDAFKARQYIAKPGGPAPGTTTNSQGCYYVKMDEDYCPSTGTYVHMQDPNQPGGPAAAGLAAAASAWW